MKVSVIVPTYNERENIVSLMKAIEKELLKFKTSFEIIIIDDNSPDGTGQEIKNKFNKHNNIRLFIRKKRRELGSAILLGIKKAKGETIVAMDADFNHPPELIPQLIIGLKNADLIVASRFIKGGGMEDKARYFFTLLFNFFLKYILGFPTMDNMSGFYAIKRDRLFSLPVNYIYRGYGEYHLRLVYLAKKNGFIIREIPVFYQKRKFGKSKSNLFFLFFKYLAVAVFLKLNDKN